MGPKTRYAPKTKIPPKTIHEIKRPIVTVLTENQEPTMPTIIEKEPNPPIIDNITTTGEEDEKSSINYYDNIDDEILRNEESTIVFEDNTSAPTITVTNNKKKKQKKAIPPEQREEMAQAFSFLAKLIDENTVEYIFEMLMEDPSDEEDTREFVRGILMKALLSQSDIYEAAACDLIVDIFAFVDDFFDAINTSSDNPITIPPTNTKIRPTPMASPPTTTNTTHTQPKDRQVPVISNNNTNKNKKKKNKKQATLPKTRSQSKTRS